MQNYSQATQTHEHSTKNKDPEVTQYIKNLKADRAKALPSIRKLIYEIAPDDVTETFEYKMPTDKDSNREFLLSLAS